MGRGYSKMLQMINFDSSGNVNINPDIGEEINTLISCDSNMMNLNNINLMGRTFYTRQKNIKSKTSTKIMVQSASDLVNENNNNNMSNDNKNFEDNKNNWNNVNNSINRRNKKGGFPKIKSDNATVVGFEREENNKNAPKNTKIIRKTQS